jgi:thioesterase domain-containing protein/acyl carrier protein
MNGPATGAPRDRRQIEAIFPLSPMQLSLLFGTLAGGAEADAGLLQLRCTLAGDLEPTRYQDAWARVVERHPTLRASVHWQEVEKPLQVVFRRVDLSWTLEDWRGRSPCEQQERLEAFLRADRERGLDLSRAPPMRLALLRLGDDEWQLAWSCHHVLLDGWSGALVLAEVATVYEALCSGREPSLPPVRPYRDYIAWLQRQDTSGVEAFWRRVLAGLSRPTPLPIAAAAAARPARAPDQGRESIELSPQTTASLQAFVRQHRLTLNVLVQAAWAALLSAHGGEAEVCFGATVSGRSAPVPGIEAMIGLFINVLPVRVSVAGQLPVSTYLARLQEEQVAIRRYEHIPLSRIQAWSEVRGGHRLFESLVVFENFPVDALGEGGEGRLRMRELRGGITTHYPLTLVVAPGERLALHLVYDRGRFGSGDAHRTLEEVAELLERLAAHPARRLAELIPGGDEERAAAPGLAGPVPTLEPAPRPEPVPPRDALELQLVQIWESVLRVHPIGVRDDFFDLGGHSLTAAQLFDQVEQLLHKRLPLATLFQAPTIEALAALLRDRGWTPPWSSLVAMQPNGSRPPLFCIHSYEGHVFFYRDLARHLAPERPVYGVQAVSLDGEPPPPARVDEMAAHYLREIRTVQPHGPYLLVGMCFGIAVAFEMAQQLCAQGETVGELIMLDSGFLTLLPEPAPAPPRTRVGRVLRDVRARAGRVKTRSRRVVEQLRETPQQRRERLFREAVLQAWYDYRPCVYPGRITLIRSTEYGAKQDWHLRTWSGLASGGVRTYLVPGDHFTMLQEPHVRHLADRLRACLDAAVESM